MGQNRGTKSSCAKTALTIRWFLSLLDINVTNLISGLVSITYLSKLSKGLAPPHVKDNGHHKYCSTL